MSNLSDFIETGGGGSRAFVASGAISTGDVVALNLDGTVSSVADYFEQTGNSSNFYTGALDNGRPAIVYDSFYDQFITLYVRSGNLYAITSSMVAGTMTYDTAITIGTVNATDCYGLDYNPTTQKAVVAYEKSTENDVYGVVVTVSDGSLSKGVEVNTLMAGSTASGGGVAYDSVNDKYVITGSSNVIVATVTVTTISYGTLQDASTLATVNSICYDVSAGAIVVVGRDNIDSDLRALAGTISGDTITFGTTLDIGEATNVFDYTNTIYMPEHNKVCVSAVNSTDIKTQIKILELSGTAITLKGSVTISSSDYSGAGYNSTNGTIIIGYADSANSYYGTLKTVAISAVGVPTVSVESLVFNSVSTRFIQPYHDTANNLNFVSYNDFGNTDYGVTKVITPSYSSNQDWIGISQDTVADTEQLTATVLKGIDETQTGLTIGSSYFVDTDGTLTTTDTGYKAGRALSATKLLVKRT